MSHAAGKRPASTPPVRRTCIAAALAVVAAGLLLPMLPAQVLAQAKAQSVSPRATAAPAAKPAKAGKSGRTGKPAAPKVPLAVKNVAIGVDAVPALPKAFLSAGCLDSRHGQWLTGELGAAAAPWRVGAHEPASESDFRLPEGGTEVASDPASDPASEPASELAVAASVPASGPDRPPAAALRCVPFAAVRSPADRIESLAVLPSPEFAEAAEGRRVMVVSRLDLGSAPTTSWHDMADAPVGYRETWMPAAGVLTGEVADQVPPLWQRDVALLVRQMKKQTQAADSALVRLVLHGEGDAARVAAVELVDDSTGQAIDSAIWLERTDAPGGFVSARGGDHERVLWQAPVDYRRISRGVGAATVIVRKRVLAKPKTPGGKPRVVIRSFRTRGQHQGIDFAAPTGTPVVTVAEGTVVHAGRSGGYGNLVVVDHGGGITTYYAHLSAYGAGIQEGTRVERGQEIGQVGSTGRSTGPHLHYEIRRDGRYLDPADPAQSLPNWALAADDHRAVLTRLLALSLSRESAFARATRQPSLAAAPQTAAAE